MARCPKEPDQGSEKQELVVASVLGSLFGDRVPSPAEILGRAMAALGAREYDQARRLARQIADNPDEHCELTATISRSQRMRAGSSDRVVRRP